jgi:hypothetical protein
MTAVAREVFHGKKGELARNRLIAMSLSYSCCGLIKSYKIARIKNGLEWLYN